MIKKLAFLLLLLTGVIPFSCCPDYGEGPYLLNLYHLELIKGNIIHRRLASVEPIMIYPKDYVYANDKYTQDTLLIRLEFVPKHAQSLSSFSLQPSAYALSCDDNSSYKELKDKIIDISITSDQVFNGIQPGDKLNDKMISFDGGYDNPINLDQMMQLVNSISGNEFLGYQSNSKASLLRYLAIIEKPDTPLERKFKVSLTYESGLQEERESHVFVW